MADLPHDPDEDDVPAEVAEAGRRAPLYVAGVDPATGELVRSRLLPEDLAGAFGDARRARDPSRRLLARRAGAMLGRL
jgi:hypothetical protein